MGPALQSPTLGGDRGAITTAFERGTLPAFARWFLARVEEVRPDYLVPAETKGARLLDVVLDYAQRELGESLPMPILYRPALPYLPDGELGRSRVLVLDDARRTGDSFARHRRRLEEFGIADVHAAFCFCLDRDGTAAAEESFLRLGDEDEYGDRICQMTELVTVGGLPPEIDHHVFQLQLPGGLRRSWARLGAMLHELGEVSVDVSREEWSGSAALTLHFPVLPGTCDFPEQGMVRHDGPRKLRLFPDWGRDLVHVVPVSFPTLDLPPGAAADMGLEDALERVRSWSRREGSLGELLVAAASRRDPETLFRAMSAFAEVDLVCGLTRAIAGSFSGEPFKVEMRGSLARRLYGEEVGTEVIGRVEEEIVGALAAPSSGSLDAGPVEAAPMFVDPAVVQTTDAIAADLRRLHRVRADELGQEPPERVGRSLAEISGALGVKRLLASRCVDFGLALTTLVPYVDVDCRPDGSCRVSRKFRVSEQKQGTDRLIDNKRLAEEIAAYVSLYVGERSDRFGRSLSVGMVTRLLAMLQPCLVANNVKIQLGAGKDGIQASVSRGGPRPILHDNASAFTLAEGQVVPAERFREAARGRTLQIQKRKLVVSIEAFLRPLVELLDALGLDDDGVAKVTEAAGMSADAALGLSFFRAPFEDVLDRLEERLAVVTRGQAHVRDGRLRAAVGDKVEIAERTIAILDSDWGERVDGLLGAHDGEIENELLRATGVPRQRPQAILATAHALVAALRASVEITIALDNCSASYWEDSDDPAEVAERVLRASTELLSALRSLREDPPPPLNPLPADPEDQLAVAGSAAATVVDALRAFAAATARENRGPGLGQPLLDPAESDRYRTLLYADLEGSRSHSRSELFDHNFNWKAEGLGLVGQWARAFGGDERGRKGDCTWMEFERPGDPAVLCGAVVRLHTAALRATHLPAPRWRPHVVVNVGRIKDAEIEDASSPMLDEMDEMCRFGDDGQAERLNMTRAVLDACSTELRETGRPIRLNTAEAEGRRLPPGCELYTIEAAPLVDRFTRHLLDVATAIREDALWMAGATDEETYPRVSLGGASVNDRRAEAGGRG